MNTIYFYILQGLFCIFSLVEFALWYRLKKYEPYRRFPKGKHYRFVPLYIAAVLAIIVTGAFMMDEPAKFRLTIISILMTPVLSIQIKNALIYISTVRELTDTPKRDVEILRLKCLVLLKCSILFYAVLIPMLIIYFK